jgi:8-oxo-dGTP pyrophosphatase MutT (NUDIX family)
MDLLAEVVSFRPADPEEVQHHGAILELLRHGRQPFSRQSFEPGHITASCFIVDTSGTRLLLHHHRRLNRWLQMGGHVDPGECAADAALREGREESGLRVLALVVETPIDLDVHAIPAGKGEPPHNHYDVRYLARTGSPEAITLDPGESNDLKWVDLAHAAELMDENGSRRVIRKIERLFA